LNDQIISTRDGGIRCYLVKWRGRPEWENSWISEENLRQLNLTRPDLIEHYHNQQQLFSAHSTRSSFFYPGGNDEGITPFEQVHIRRRHIAFLVLIYSGYFEFSLFW